MRRRLLALLVLGLWSVSLAQSAKDEAIAMAAEHPALAALLGAYGGWTADAYRPETSYEVWRVQFYFPSGAELGWADVSLDLGEVLAWEASYELTGKRYEQAERALYRFVRNDGRVRALVGDTDRLEKWFWYDSWREGWFVHLERGVNSLDVSIRSRFKGSLKLSNLFVEKIYLPNLLSYADYQQANRSSAVALAFAEPEIATALRDKAGWTSSAEPSDARWEVRFSLGEEVLATAVVDLTAQRVQSYEVGP